MKTIIYSLLACMLFVGCTVTGRLQRRGYHARAMYVPQEQKEVILNRPFLYLIIDCTANLPLFIGTADTVTEI